jgi:hypothetical protein
MTKTMLVLMVALAMGGILATAVPTASAMYCAGYGTLGGYVAQKCNYVVGGEAARDASATVTFVGEEAHETIQFIWDTYGDDLP